MLPFKRSSSNKIDRWFFTVNKGIFFATLGLIFIGVILVLTASPYTALRIGISPFYFFSRHLLYVVLALFLLIFTSFLNKEQVITFATIIFIISIIVILLVLVLNIEVKGAKRWLYVWGISIQPSEFLKVCFPIVIANMWQQLYKKSTFMTYVLITIIYLVSVFLIIMQPDLGMVILLTLVFGSILFLLDIKIGWLLLLAISGVVLLVFAYLTFSHVHFRINSFFHDTKPYQVMKAYETLQNGKLLGVGAGNGYFKQYLPDAHTDFIFVAAVEEYGLIFAFILLSIFCYLFFNIFKVLTKIRSYFVYISVAGLGIILVIQTLIHVSSNINLIPTKGMTLPFISYGGSSLMANALLIGFILALTRKEY